MTIELQEILNEEHQEAQRNVSPSEQEEDKRGPMPTSAIKDLMKKWEAVRAMVLEWHPNQAESLGILRNEGTRNRLKTELRNSPEGDVMLAEVSHHPMTHLPEPPLFSPFTVFCPPTHQAAIHQSSQAEVDR
ncbi:uncharacterized protein TNCV_4270141 [Trichonephila clavipes]|nr:uncharacterized protein TNCV_4270141 [Trichonephila clavipes]